MINLKLILILILAIVAAAIDFVWLGKIVSGFYKNQLGDLMRPAGVFGDVRIFGAVAVYLLLAVGIVFFVLPHATTAGPALVWGALFGLVTYGIYDMTNWAVLTRWPFTLALADIAWGIVLMAFLSWIAFRITPFLS